MIFIFYIYSKYLINQKSASFFRFYALVTFYALFFCCCQICFKNFVTFNSCKCRDKSNPMLLYCKFKGHYLPPCAPPLLAPLTLPFKNFNRATFTTYYIKKTAAKFTLNGVLLMLFFINLSRLLQFCHLEKITRPQDYFEILPVRKLKRLRNTALDPCSATFSNLRHTLKKFLN